MQEQSETGAQPHVRPWKETTAHQSVTDAPLGLE